MKGSDKKASKKIAKYLYWRIMLIPALALEVIALLMDKGIMNGTEQLVTRFTAAGGVLVFIYLVCDGLSRKYRHYSKKWGMGPYAEDADSKSENNGKKKK